MHLTTDFVILILLESISSAILYMASDSKKLIADLKNLGFNEYKAKVFLCLCKGGLMTAAEIAKDAKIVRGSIYDILKSFVEKGYCNEIDTNRVLQYQIIDPDVIIDKIERDYKDDYNSRLSQLKDTFKEVKNIYTTQIPAKDKYINIELIRGFNKHRVSKYREFLLNAEKEICGMYHIKGIISEDSVDVANEFIKKGGKIRSIFSSNLDFQVEKNGKVTDAGKDDFIKVIYQFEKMGEAVRISELNIPNMTIVDRENVFINSTDKGVPKQFQADLIMRRSDFAKNMYDLFNYYWNDSMTIDEFKKKDTI
jgi:HTH-type transcriptional regulator, sugar sensing transcriptional regulator